MVGLVVSQTGLLFSSVVCAVCCSVVRLGLLTLVTAWVSGVCFG